MFLTKKGFAFLHFVDFVLYKYSEKPVKNGLKGLNFENSLWLRKYMLIRIFPLYFDKFWPFGLLPDFLRPSRHSARAALAKFTIKSLNQFFFLQIRASLKDNFWGLSHLKQGKSDF